MLRTEPRVVMARSGYLAVSPPGATPRIGVIGATEEEARRRFSKALDAWDELEERRLRECA